ncbi:MAG: hypothetical protein M5U09_25345 [Gammaproteobacteria bacterium]|nr:hypothetical protein [Gammaproteobacteria bacterium]
MTSNRTIGRPATLAAMLTGAVFAAASLAASAQTVEELAAKAASEGEIVWYEANSPEMGDKLVAAFNEGISRRRTALRARSRCAGHHHQDRPGGPRPARPPRT